MASYAAAIQDKLNIEPTLQKGAVGQFDVVVDGEIVVSRKGGLLAKLFRKPWPEIDDVVTKVQARVGSAAT